MSATVCLVMIVKDEEHVIERCLRSVAPLVDSYLITDTGSTDGTREKIRAVMGELGKHGDVADEPWVDFGTNRSRAFERARAVSQPADYALVIDADDVLAFPGDTTDADSQGGQADPAAIAGARRSLGSHDAYDLQIVMGNFRWMRLQLFRQRLPWRYDGSLHEHAECSAHFTRGTLPGVEYRCLGGGGRRKDPAKVDIEIGLLMKDLAAKPDDPRTTYYLAQTYYDNGRSAEAIEWGEKVLLLRGWSEERFTTALRLGDMYLGRGEDGDAERAQDRYTRAMGMNSSRAEPHERLARFHRTRAAEGWAQPAYVFAKRGSEIRPDPGGHLVDIDCHAFKIWDELVVAAYWTGRYEECVQACERILKLPVGSQPGSAPENLRLRTEENKKYALRMLAAKRSAKMSKQRR